MVDRDGATVTFFSSLTPDEHLESCVSVQAEKITRLHGVESPHDQGDEHLLDRLAGKRSKITVVKNSFFDNSKDLPPLSTANWLFNSPRTPSTKAIQARLNSQATVHWLTSLRGSQHCTAAVITPESQMPGAAFGQRFTISSMTVQIGIAEAEGALLSNRSEQHQ
ncbi:hypothetical protein PGT21_012032 [Puccinia graminis f. sp. tritici]|uniref:Uncharacterized protein n=1 Tax=Puccinia graminis f. sp. tritici TaxID=56615 RepID=A0A5B0P931_PUCGR|nr:hypothetical protein PGT21_012032 [Puccinia graminis f. sp. tritici]KAA1134045.1 hypothetical protein PGTUg99_020929 [Puccinia graminis f. sp. tritici]